MTKIRFIQFIALTAILSGALSTGCSAKAKKARYLDSAEKDFAAGRYARAEVEYMNVLRLEPMNTRAIGRLGAIYYEEGRLNRAFPLLTKAAELSPDDMGLQVKLASIFLADGRVKEVREKVNLVLEKTPTNAEAPSLLAESAASVKDVEEIRQRLEKLSAQVGDTAAIHLALGTLEFRSRNLDKAEAEFRRALALDDKSSAAHYGIGNLCWAKNDLKCAETELKSASELAPARSTRRIKYAEFKFKTGDPATAKQVLAQALKEGPEYLPATILQAQIAIAEQSYTEAGPLIEQILALDSGNYQALMLRGRMLVGQHEPAKALAEFESLAALYDRSPEVHYQLATAYVLNNDTPKAVKSVSRALALDPHLMEAVLLQAQLNLMQGDVSAAVSSLSEVVRQQPRLPQAHLTLAAAYVAQGNFDAALEHYKIVGEMFPNSPEIPFRIGSIYAQQKKNSEARTALAKSLELSPDYAPALEQLINLDLDEKKYPEALARAEKQREKRPQAADPLVLIAKIHLAHSSAMLNEAWAQEKERQQPLSEASAVFSRTPAAQTELDEAEKALEKAINLDPGFQDSYLTLAGLYVNSGRSQQALQRLKDAVVKDPKDARALMLMATIYEAKKDNAGARESYEKLLKVNPSLYPALNNLAYIYTEDEKLRDLDRAYELAKKARELLTYSGASGQPVGDNSTETLRAYSTDTLGWVVFRRGDFPYALNLLQEAAARLPAEPEIQFHAGMVYYMLGKEDTARAAFQRALSLNKDFPGKAETLKRLDTLNLDTKKATPENLANLEDRLRQQPADPVLLARVTDIYQRNGARDKTVSAYEASLKANRKNVPVLVKLARLYAEDPGTRSRALDLAKEAYKLSPGDPETAGALGRLAFEAGDQKWALSLLEQANKTQSPEVFYDLGMAYYSVGRTGDAIAAVQNALQSGQGFSRTNDAQTFLDLVPLSESVADALKAEARATERLKSKPEDVPSLMIVGRCLEERAQSADARQVYERVMKKYPDFVPAEKRLALLYSDAGEEQKAYDMASRARQALPQDLEIANAYGAALYLRARRTGNTEDYRSCLRLLNESADQKTGDGRPLYYSGMAHYQLSKTVKAPAQERAESKQALTQAVSLKLPAPQMAEAKRVLAEIGQ
jgi:tetratricopeptide (TPR) repeat protein